VHPADPLGSLTPAEVPLIEAEKLSEQAGPPHQSNSYMAALSARKSNWPYLLEKLPPDED
jgi:hypothetical protein